MTLYLKGHLLVGAPKYWPVVNEIFEIYKDDYRNQQLMLPVI